jgi:hypothetical protein
MRERRRNPALLDAWNLIREKESNMEFKRRREYIETVYYERSFWFQDDPEQGFGFDCNEDGELLENTAPEARANYERCLTGEVDGRVINDEGIRKRTHGYWEPAVGICERCDREVILDGFTCTCDCGVDYNSSGQRLAPRSQWGEETGESLSDILRIP